MPDTNAVAPWGAETRSSCGGGDLVLVDEFAEHIVPSDGGGLRGSPRGVGAVNGVGALGRPAASCIYYNGPDGTTFEPSSSG
jgi:hypothetical protein